MWSTGSIFKRKFVALRMGNHKVVEVVGAEIRKLAFSDVRTNKSPRLKEPAHSKRVFIVFVKSL